MRFNTAPNPETRHALARALTKIRELKMQVAQRSSLSASVAIVGAAGRFPGAPNVRAFWELCARGGCSISAIPEDRFDTSGVPARAGLLERVDTFDHAFFGLSPAEARMMDPQHRMLLETSWDALDAAKLSPDQSAGSTGMYIGIMNSDYREIALQEPDTYTGTGNTACFSAGRISHLLGLHGPALCLDTACSSSLVTVHLACQSLRSGEVDLALAGGCSLILSREVMELTARTGALSSTGESRIFDARANGYVRGEGCAVVVLKRFDDAIRDGDEIWAVIRGSAVNHDGRSSTLTAPNPEIQERVVRQALADAGITPEQLGYVEAHGTGTSIGDPIELDGLARVLGRARGCSERCYIGSGKANIGHLEAAAGVTGLLRAIGALRSKRIYPQVNFETLNPRVSLRGTNLEISRGCSWETDERRIAGVSAFGMSGTNAHVIIEEAPEVEERPFQSGLYDSLLAVSAKTPEALDSLVDAWQELAKSHDMKLLAHTAARRSVFEHKAILRARGAEFERIYSKGRSTCVRFVFADTDVLDRNFIEGVLSTCERAYQLFKMLEQHFWHEYELALDAPTHESRRAFSFASQLAFAEYIRELGVREPEVVGVGAGALAAGVFAEAWPLELASAHLLELVRTHALVLPQREHPKFRFDILESANELWNVDDSIYLLGLGGISPCHGDVLAGQTQLLDAISTLFVEGHLAEWCRVVAPVASEVSMPVYPWNRTSHWVGEPPGGHGPGSWIHHIKWEHQRPQDVTKRVGIVLIFGSNEDIRIARAFEAHAVHVVLIESSERFSFDAAKASANIRVGSLSELLHVREQIEQVLGEQIDRVVVSPTFGDRAGVDRRTLAKHFAHVIRSWGCPMWFMTRGAEAARSEHAARIEAPLGGLLRALFFETHAVGGTIDLEEECSKSPLSWVSEVMNSRKRFARLRVSSSGLSQAIITRAFADERPSISCDSSGSYLVTGGTGGIGRRFVDALIRAGARHVFVTSRREPCEAVRAWISRADEVGANIEWVRADASREQDMQDVFERIHASGKPLRGIGHAAGVGGSTPMEDMTEQEYARVCGAKIDGGWILHKFALGASIEFFLGFSSIAAVLAGRGQGAYAAANAGLDALITHRRSLGLPGTSVRWGLWGGEGIPNETERERIEALGLEPMDGDQALSLLGTLVSSQASAPIVASVKWSTCIEMIDAAGENPLFHVLRPHNAESEMPALEKSIVRSSAQIRELVLSMIARHADVPAAMIPLDRSLAHIGLDSLGAYALKGSLQNHGVELSTELFIDGSSIQQLIDAALNCKTITPDRSRPEPLLEPVVIETMPENPSVKFSPTERWRSASRGVDRGWFVKQTAEIEAKHRLICFPYAGGSPSVFADWTGEMPLGIEIFSAQLPARAARLSEPPVKRMRVLIDALVDAYMELESMPTAFMGHCFGALIMYELAHALAARGLELPTYLFVSGARSPQSYTQMQLLADVEQFSPKPPLQLPELDDDALVDALTEMRFADTVEALHQPELRQLLLPAVRADFEMSNNYFYSNRPSLPVPIFAMGGRADGYVTALQLLGWREHTNADFSHEYCSGGHYFIAENRERWIKHICSRLHV